MRKKFIPGALVKPDSDAQLEALVRQYGRLIRKIASSVGGRAIANVSEDIEQRVMLGIWRQLEREQTIKSPVSYIYRAAVRETVRVLRHEVARQQESIDALGLAVAAPGKEDPHRALAAREQAVLIEASVRKLAPDRRRAVKAHLAGFAVTEIMTLYGWSYQKARNLVARGIADLRKTLREQGIHV